MAFRNHQGWTHNMIKTGPQNLAYYTNNHNKIVYIHSVTAKLGSGYGHFVHEPAGEGDGTGQTLYANLVSRGQTSNTVIINNVVPSNGRKANIDYCKPYTFTFNPPLTIPAGSTDIPVQIEWSGGDTMCFDKYTEVTGDIKSDPTYGPDIEIDAPDVYPMLIHPNGGYIFNGTDWVENEILVTQYASGINTYVGTMKQPERNAYYDESMYARGYTLTGFTAVDLDTGEDINITVQKNIFGEQFFFDGEYPGCKSLVLVGDCTSSWIFKGDYGNPIGLIAQWQINQYTLLVDPAGGTWNGSKSTQTLTEDYLTVISIPDPEPPANKVFAGWYVEGYGDLNMENRLFVFGDGPTEIQAVYTDSIDSVLTIDPNGGQMIQIDQTITQEKFDVLYNNAFPRYLSSSTVKDGDTFKIYNFMEGYAFGMPWKPGYMCLDWNVVSGPGVVALVPPSTLRAHINDNLTEQVMIDSCYSFMFGTLDGESGKAEIRANWTPNKYNLIYDLNLPSNISSEEAAKFITPDTETYNYEDVVNSLPVLPDLENYEFKGWNFAPVNIGVLEDVAIDLLVNAVSIGFNNTKFLYYPESNITMYAIWVQKGLVNIYLNDQWQKAQVYIYANDTEKWKRAIPYMYAIDSWKQITGG